MGIERALLIDPITRSIRSPCCAADRFIADGNGAVAETQLSGPALFLDTLEARFSQEGEVLAAAIHDHWSADHLRQLLGRTMPPGIAVGSGRVISASNKVPASEPQPAVLYDVAANAALAPLTDAGVFPIEAVYATVGRVQMMTEATVRAALAEIAATRKMARRGKYYTTYVRIEKPNGKTMSSLREIRLDSEPRSYLVAQGVDPDGPLGKPDRLAKALKDWIGAEEHARLHGLLVLDEGWFLYQPAYKKRLEYQTDRGLLRFCHKIATDLHGYEMYPVSLDRYFKQAE